VSNSNVVANDGYAPVREMLGFMYMNGNGVKKDTNTAIHSFLLSLNDNDPLFDKARIFNSLGILYTETENYVAGFEYYHAAAVIGDAYAQANVADDYAMGRGVIQDNIKSYAWLSVAIAQGLGSRQASAEAFQSVLAYRLGWAYIGQAKTLAKKYYKLYVLQ